MFFVYMCGGIDMSPVAYNIVEVDPHTKSLHIM